MLKTSMWEYENRAWWHIFFISKNWQPIHKTICMQIIKKIMWEVLPAITLKCQQTKTSLKPQGLVKLGPWRARKPVFGVCDQQGHRPVCASAQFDQISAFVNRLLVSIILSRLFMGEISLFLATCSLCNWAMSKGSILQYFRPSLS